MSWKSINAFPFVAPHYLILKSQTSSNEEEEPLMSCINCVSVNQAGWNRITVELKSTFVLMRIESGPVCVSKSYVCLSLLNSYVCIKKCFDRPSTRVTGTGLGPKTVKHLFFSLVVSTFPTVHVLGVGLAEMPKWIRSWVSMAFVLWSAIDHGSLANCWLRGWAVSKALRHMDNPDLFLHA